jgi:hypothetical protein
LYFFSAGNECHFCPAPAQLTLCEQCFSKAWTVAQEYYSTNNVNIMVEKGMCGYEGDALTFRYASFEREEKGDITDAEFVISDWDSIMEYCKYNREPRYSKKWIDLSTGHSSEFWKQAGL